MSGPDKKADAFNALSGAALRLDANRGHTFADTSYVVGSNDPADQAIVGADFTLRAAGGMLTRQTAGRIGEVVVEQLEAFPNCPDGVEMVVLFKNRQDDSPYRSLVLATGADGGLESMQTYDAAETMGVLKQLRDPRIDAQTEQKFRVASLANCRRPD